MGGFLLFFNVLKLQMILLLITACSGGLKTSVDSKRSSGSGTGGPTIVDVTSSKKDGIYKAGETIDILVVFSDTVVVTGIPTLALSTMPAQIIKYVSGSGTTNLLFNYSVQNGDSAAKLDVASPTALSLNGGTIQNSSALTAVLTLPAPDSVHSLSKNKNIVIDAVPPKFYSIDLIAAGIDGYINALEKAGANNIIGNLQGYSYDTAEYTVTIAGIDCSSAIGYTTTAPFSNNSGMNSDRAYQVCVRLSDKAGNTSVYGVSAPFTVKTDAPGSFTISAITSPTPADPLISWSAATGAVVYDLRIARDAGCTDIAKTATNIAATSYTIDPVFSGTYYVCATAKDQAGNPTSASNNGVVSFVVPDPIVLSQPSATATKLDRGVANIRRIDSDGTHFVAADFSTNRVLIWNQIPKSNLTPADVVLGQPNLISNATNNGGVNAASLNSPTGVSLCAGKIYVADASNSRVLVWNSLPTANNQPADLVLGQPNMTSNTSNNGGISSSTLNAPQSVRCDGTRLFVADTANNRVLVWNTLPSTNAQAADLVLGQPDMASNTSNFGGISSHSMAGPQDVYYAGGRLFVADPSNNRILIWNSFPTTANQSADVVLGQSTMTTNTANNGGISAASLYQPTALYVSGTRLYATDNANCRLLIWLTIPTTNKTGADLVFGQPDMTSSTINNGGMSATSSYYPSGITGDTSHIYYSDGYNHRILVWNHLINSSQETPDLVIGQATLNVRSVHAMGINATSAGYAQNAHFDGTHLIASDYWNHRVLIWNSLPTSNNQPADIVLGQADMASNLPNAGTTAAAATNLFFPIGVYSDGTRLVVGDAGNSRVLIWSTFPTSNQTPADLVLGQTNLTTSGTNSGGLSAASLNFPRSVCINGTKLFVVDNGNNRVLIWNTFPTTNKQSADLVVGQPNMTTATAGSGASGMTSPVNLYCNATRLLVSEIGSNRVLSWTNHPTANGQAADMAIGQKDLTSAVKPTSPSTSLYAPTGIAFGDGHLYIGDSFYRILVWNTFPTSGTQPPDRILGKPDFTNPNTVGMNLNSFYPQGIFADNTRLFISDTGNDRTLIVPHVLPNFATATHNGLPASISSSTVLNVSVSGAGSTAIAYRYKLGPTGTTDCSALTGYSSSISVTTPITDNISGISDGNLKLCTITQDNSGNWQPASFASTYSWNKSTSGIGSFAFTSSAAPVTTTTPTITWSAASGAVTYDLIVANDWGCTSPIETITGLAGTSRTISALAEGTYNLCLTARAASGGTAEPTNNHFAIAVDITAPGAFAITGPVTTNSASPLVSWSGSAGAWVYDLKIATASGCASPLQSYTSIGGTNRTLTTLAEGTYFACLSARDGAGNSTAATNTNYSFTVDTTPPGSFNITGPSTSASPIPAVTWGASATATNYQVIFAYDSGCRTNIIQTFTGVTTTSKRPATAFTDGTYYACVTAYDAAGNAAVASNSPYSFTVANATYALGRPDVVTNGMEDGVNYLVASTTGDGTRMFVADSGNNRILIWNSVPTATQTLPDVVLGHSSPTLAVSSVTGGVTAPSDSYSDGTHLFVADSSANRVLIWNTIPTVSNTLPDVVLGQPTMSASTSNNGGISAQSLSSPWRVFSDGTKLFVVDRSNHRVLVWNTIPTVNQTAADVVIGQPNMTSNTANNGGISAQTLNFPTGVYKVGTALFISDQSNNRVLKFNTVPTANSTAADFVLGQANMTSSSAGITSQTLSAPYYVAGSGTKLFVADYNNNRVLIWNTIPTANQTAADVVLGQPNMTSSTLNNGGLSAQTLYNPRSVTSDGTRLFVTDSANGRILIWNAIPTVSQTAANIQFGHTLMTKSGFNGDLGASQLTWPTGITGDGTRLIATDFNNSRVLIWNTLPTSTAQAADVVVGQPDMVSNSGAVTSQKLNLPRKASSDGTRLFIVDSGNNRVLMYSAIPTANNTAASFVLGQPSFTVSTANNGGLSAQTMSSPFGVSSDGTNLAVADTANNRVLLWTSIPTGNQQAANFVLGQPNMTSNTVNNGGISAQTLASPRAAIVKGGKLFVADTSNNRVLIWNTIPTSSQQAADVVLGQPSMTANTSNNGGISNKALSSPYDLYCDGTRLYVADNTNQRILVWSTIPTTNQQSADYVIGQPNFTSAISNVSGLNASGVQYPMGVYGDGTKVYIGDTYNNRTLIVPLQ